MPLDANKFVFSALCCYLLAIIRREGFKANLIAPGLVTVLWAAATRPPRGAMLRRKTVLSAAAPNTAPSIRRHRGLGTAPGQGSVRLVGATRVPLGATRRRKTAVTIAVESLFATNARAAPSTGISIFISGSTANVMKKPAIGLAKVAAKECGLAKR